MSHFKKLWTSIHARVQLEESVGMFSMTLGHNEGNRMIKERFQHSGETVSRHFNRVLSAIAKFSMDEIKPPDTYEIPYHIRGNPKYWPYFKVIH